MATQGQHMVTQGPEGQQVIVVTVPTRSEDEQAPGVKRGTYIGDCHIGGCGIQCLVIIGAMGLVVSFSLWGASDNPAFYVFPSLLTLASGACCCAGLKAGRKAEKEYNALPLDHPDRIKYGGVQVINLPPQQQSGASNVPPGTYTQPPSGEGYKPSIDYTGPPPRPYSQPSPQGNIHHPSAPRGYMQPSEGYKPSIDYSGPPPRPYGQPSSEGDNQPHGNYNQNPSARPTYNIQPFDYTGPPPGPYNQPPPETEDPPPPYDQLKM